MELKADLRRHSAQAEEGAFPPSLGSFLRGEDGRASPRWGGTRCGGAMGIIAVGGRRLVERSIRRGISQRADVPVWRRSALTFALLAPLPGGLVVWLLLGWLRRRLLQAW